MGSRSTTSSTPPWLRICWPWSGDCSPATKAPGRTDTHEALVNRFHPVNDPVLGWTARSLLRPPGPAQGSDPDALQRGGGGGPVDAARSHRAPMDNHAGVHGRADWIVRAAALVIAKRVRD